MSSSSRGRRRRRRRPGTGATRPNVFVVIIFLFFFLKIGGVFFFMAPLPETYLALVPKRTLGRVAFTNPLTHAFVRARARVYTDSVWTDTCPAGSHVIILLNPVSSETVTRIRSATRDPS